MPSTGLPVTETMLPARHEPAIELTSFQWGIGRGISHTSSVIELTSFQWGVGRGITQASPAQSHVVENVRLRRIVMDATVAPTGGSMLPERPTESISFNFQTITLN
jgi:hypothetical protein